MNEPTPDKPAPPLGAHHYQVLGLCALGIIFVVQVQHGALPVCLIPLVLGFASLLLKARFSPLLVLLAIAAGSFYLQDARSGFERADEQLLRLPPLQVQDVIFCMAVLAYMVAHYRLTTLWVRILPSDPRRRHSRDATLIIPKDQVGVVLPQKRSPGLLTPVELAWFILQLPLYALVAQGVWYLLTTRWSPLGLPPRGMLLLQIAWALTVLLFVVGQFFRYWRRTRMDLATAQLLLQDLLWHETRGEQRRVNRWLAWWKLRQAE